MDKIRVMLVEDHSMVRQGLKQLIELESDIKVVAEAANGTQAADYYQIEKPDVVLMDINMPKKNGLQALELIKQNDPDAKIIMLTIHSDREYLFEALQLGASGYVLKDADGYVLIEAIRKVYEGEMYIQPTMAKELVMEFKRYAHNGKNSSKKENILSEREIEVLRLVAKGLLNKEIAQTLYISEKTVKNHISNIFKKLKVSDRTQAAVYALKHNLI
ncbi:transcriptional regulatory protein DegU [Thermoclostridium stercorarium subsp. stercorarium DSM 8532]|uniref:Stage 0 sporulation protein A homolog n=3 Tax=Thermoclostridium stercorarium TaxID=1510 RepID=L7VQ28_THES1|nr:response regulator transcription factor [Thermoclostridium stercorarium]AGC68536.1 transcriptional regulatory protein DegU [Thermoclostridium stercorarium subsp. stercorarium DSM 8532]AGI39552.1 transcriptional regulator [Thermoclostridium stercorarium subsp. stercorarium DSM 8532]ANW98887.1 DNA-binding response regulator [Thermoclostridium stercorarium subsp. thermolacticum DSM 2910]ANX01414.1 DNA-binding response regulator [Thermoclostridium stercorarium subsp. leptospartum DSM 9219]UZQ84